jgi:hypothetical protein
LKYTDGTPVTQVDVVAHIMGGLIVRCYLSGKQTTSGDFEPPPTPAIRKMVFLAVPNFGSPIATLLGFGLDAQAEELANGTVFSFDLGTWNQGTDDLRGVDALAAAGNGGTGLTTMAGFDRRSLLDQRVHRFCRAWPHAHHSVLPYRSWTGYSCRALPSQCSGHRRRCGG